MKFSFVIPTYNRYDLVHQVLYDIYRRCSDIHEVIVMDDASPEDMSDGVNWWMTNGMLPVRHVRMKENKGFLRNSNTGIRLATGEMVCLVSNDVRIHKDISKYCYGFEKNTIFGGRLLDWDTGWNTFGKTTYPYLEGWLLVAHNDAWTDIGGFDERFMPYDYEDVDFSTSAISKGYGLVPFPDGYATHIGAQSIHYGDEREEQTQRNRKKFEEKWITK